jgi:hypothetical protein
MEPNSHLATVYSIYATASIGLTIWLARTLAKNGEVFLEDVFADNPRMATAVNRLLVVGFYLLNLGYAFSTLKASTAAPTPVAAIEILAVTGRPALHEPVSVPPHPSPGADPSGPAAGEATDAP